MYIKPVFLFFVYILDFHIQSVFLYFMRLYVCHSPVMNWWFIQGVPCPLPVSAGIGFSPYGTPCWLKQKKMNGWISTVQQNHSDSLEMMENPTIVLQNEGVLCLLSWLMLFGYDNWLYNTSIRNAPKRLIQYLVHPVDHYHTFYYMYFGGYSVWFWWAVTHLHLLQRKRLQPLRENDFSCWVIFQ